MLKTIKVETPIHQASGLWSQFWLHFVAGRSHGNHYLCDEMQPFDLKTKSQFHLCKVGKENSSTSSKLVNCIIYTASETSAWTHVQSLTKGLQVWSSTWKTVQHNQKYHSKIYREIKIIAPRIIKKSNLFSDITKPLSLKKKQPFLA